MHYAVPKEGKYYFFFGSCDPTSHNIRISGNTTVMTSFGQLPGRSYGLLPFLKLLLLGYSVLLVSWISRCFFYRKELMSVHVIIFFLILFLLFDTLLRIVNLTAYNINGVYTPFISFFSVLFSTATSTLSRCLAIVLMLGYLTERCVIGRLGVTRASLGSETWHVFIMGLIFFGVMLWDNYCRTFSGSIELSLTRGIVVSLVDGYIYYYIMKALLHTIAELESMKQTSKLELFKKLRKLYFALIIISVLYSIFFGLLIFMNVVDRIWKWSWFFNSGIWSVINICLLCIVMVRKGGEPEL